MIEGRDVDYMEEMSNDSIKPHDPVPVNAMHPLYLLYTSGTTGLPKVMICQIFDGYGLKGGHNIPKSHSEFWMRHVG